jgi:hypothetical protein
MSFNESIIVGIEFNLLGLFPDNPVEFDPQAQTLPSVSRIR